MESASPILPDPAGYVDAEPFSFTAHGQELTFYPAGKDRLAALLGLIDEAQSSLKLYYYIFSTDACAARVRDALAAAAARGVAVTLMLDGFGADASDDFLAALIEAGGRVLRFSPRWNTRYLVRNHQKMLIADDRTALIGGFNIEQSYFDPPDSDGWHDMGVSVCGDSVAKLVDWYRGLERWTANPRAQFLAMRRLVRGWHPGTGPVRWLMGGPTRALNSWARCVVRDIERASRLDMIMAYFSPSGRMLRRIGRVASRGDVRLVLAAKSDNAATVGASRALYGGLLRCGAKIYEFEPCKLHTKLIVVDDAVYVGSANFDMRSLYLNLELMLRIEDAELAQRMREYIAGHCLYSTEVTPALDRQRRTIPNRIRWWLSWWLVSVVDYTVSRRLNLGL